MTWHCARQNEIRLTGNQFVWNSITRWAMVLSSISSMAGRALLMLDDSAQRGGVL
jgi:hypothetical protein